MLSNFIFNSWFNNFPILPRTVSNAASSNFVFVFPSCPFHRGKKNVKREQHRNENVKTARQTFRVSFQGKSENFLSTIDNEKNSVIFISLLLPSPLGSLFLRCELKRLFKPVCAGSLLGIHCTTSHQCWIIFFSLVCCQNGRAACGISLGPNAPPPHLPCVSAKKRRTTHNGDLKIQ